MRRGRCCGRWASPARRLPAAENDFRALRQLIRVGRWVGSQPTTTSPFSSSQKK